ncbi:MAG: WYL domain-containing protein [Eubacteriales bacterium]|nr:WYL domain-containing protein [Eubacteriales bacterium]
MLTTATECDTSSYVYDAAGRTLLSDENGECTRTLYDDLGRTVQEIAPEDYDSTKDGLPTENTYSDSNAGQRYYYNSETGNLDREINRLDVVTDYEYYDTGEKKTEFFDIYEFNYDNKGNVANIEISGNLYATYNYDGNLLESIDYGNDQTVFYEYNDLSQIVYQKYKDSETAPVETQYEYTYTENSDDDSDFVLSSKIDYTNNQITEYDGNTVTISNFEIVDGEISVTGLYYSYEESEENTENDTENSEEDTSQYLNQRFADSTLNTTFNENCDVFTKDDQEICRYNYQYDESGELLSTSITNTADGEEKTVLSTAYEYNEKGYVSKMTNTFAKGEIVSTYSYDELGRLVEYHPDEGSVAYYVYDSKGQLVREDYQLGSASATVTYKYDSRGNLETVKQYPFTRGDITQAPETTEEMELEYENEIWLDAVTQQDDDTLLYDSQGNLIKLGDCDFNWTNGRQLSSILYTDENGETEDLIKYTYDEYGVDKKLHNRLNSDGDVREYIINPYTMATTNGKYYLICNNDKYDGLSNYRLDRITDIEVLDTPRKPKNQVEGLVGLDVAQYMNEHIYMFTGKSVSAKIEMPYYLISDVLDYFKANVNFKELENGKILATVKANETDIRMWAKLYAGQMKVISPKSLADGCKQDLIDALKIYDD